MTVFQRPTVRAGWCDAGTPGAANDIVDPDVQTSSAFVAAGWTNTATPPARQFFNWVLNYVTDGIRYLCQQGTPDWSAAETYDVAATALGPDNKIYTSLQTNNTNHTPATSPTWWGPPLVPTASAADNTAKIANTAFVTGAVATSLTAAEAFTTSAVSGLAPLASPALTGTPTAPTPLAGDNTTKLATTAFVQTALNAGVGSTYAAYAASGSTTASNLSNLIGVAVLAAGTYRAKFSAQVNVGGTSNGIYSTEVTGSGIAAIGSANCIAHAEPTGGGPGSFAIGNGTNNTWAPTGPVNQQSGAVTSYFMAEALFSVSGATTVEFQATYSAANATWQNMTLDLIRVA